MQQQRLVLAAAVLLGQSEKTGPNREVRDFSWDEHVRYLYDAEFKLRYRVSWDSFNTLLRILEPGLRVANEAQAMKSRSGKAIELSTRLAVALRYFAGGCPLDLICIYKISKTQVFRCIWLVVDAVNTYLKNMHFPIDDADALAELELGFRAATRGDFWRGQVGAIDGVHFKMRAPTNKDVDNPMRYYVSRKDTFALLAVAICDVNRRFLWADISHTSTTHDSTAWTATELGQTIAQGGLPEPYFINGDAAFTLGPSMITPSNNDKELDDFDFYQSSNRMAIECAFGILVRRWGVLWRALGQRFDRRAPLVIALMRLHNFIIDERLKTHLPEQPHDMPDVQLARAQVVPGRFQRTPAFDKDGRPLVHLDTCRATDEGAPTRAAREGTPVARARRDELARAVKDSGYTRPPVDKNAVVRKRKRPKGRAPRLAQ